MIGNVARQTLAALAIRARLCRIIARDSALVLRYHRVAGTRGDPMPRAVPEGDFEAQLRLLSARCNVVGLPEIVDALLARRALPPGAVALSFDGGYEDNFSAAFPILKQFDLPATFFIAAGWIETSEVLWWERLHDYIRQAAAERLEPVGQELLPEPVAQAFQRATLDEPGGPARLEKLLAAAVGGINCPPERTDELVESIAGVLGADVAPALLYQPMTWQQVKLLRAGGMTIGSHTMSRARLTTLRADRAHEELVASKAAIENQLGEPIDLVAYPEGRHNADVADLAEEAGYRAAFTTHAGPIHRGDNPFALRRASVRGADDRGALGAFSASLFALRVRRLARAPE